MADYTQKEKCVGLFGNKEVRFTRVWGGHRFSDEECEALLNGEEIEFDVEKDGVTRHYVGSLAEQTYNGNKFYGFLRNELHSFLGHKFTENEQTMLKAGKVVRVEDLVSKAGNKFAANITWKNGEGFKLSFD